MGLNESLKAQQYYPDAYILTTYSYIGLGDIYSIQNQHEKAKDKYYKALKNLKEYETKYEIHELSLMRGTFAYISAKLLFEEAIIQSEELNYSQAAILFNESAEKLKSLISNDLTYVDNSLLKGYYHYCISNSLSACKFQK